MCMETTHEALTRWGLRVELEDVEGTESSEKEGGVSGNDWREQLEQSR